MADKERTYLVRNAGTEEKPVWENGLRTLWLKQY